MKIIKEFKVFAMRGNVIDLAIGIIIGSAFGKIVSSLVADIITPIIGILVGGVSFEELKFVLKEAVPAQLDAAGNAISEIIPAVTINYGMFMQVIFDFLIIAFAIFFVIRTINSLKRKEEAAPDVPPAPSKEELLLTEIRDLLKK